jgi:hypothetical protein
MGWIEDKISQIPEPVRNALGISSPSKVMAEVVGVPIVTGIMQGMRDALPQLLDLASDLGDQLVNKIKSATSGIGRIIEDAFGATADFNRQLADNIERVSELPDFLRDSTQRQLEQARAAAMQFTNPADQAKFFQMRSDQIFELNELYQAYAEATTDADRDSIVARIDLIKAAQDAERKAFEEKIKNQKSAYLDMAQSLADALGQAYDPVMADLLRKFIQLVGLGQQILVPGAPMGTGKGLNLLAGGAGLVSSSIPLQRRGAGGFIGATSERGTPGEKHYHLHINTTPDGVGPLVQEFGFLEAYAIS